VRRDGAAIEVLTSNAERVARELLAQDSRLTGLEITGAGLEDAFLALTSGTGEGGTADQQIASMVVAGGMR
jgi:hypothetical protein